MRHQGAEVSISSIADHQVMILDLSDVPMIDVTAGLALENAIKDANCEVLLLCPHSATRQQLEKFHILDLISNDNNFSSREKILQSALAYIATV